MERKGGMSAAILKEQEMSRAHCALVLLVGGCFFDIGKGASNRNDADKEEKVIHDSLLCIEEKACKRALWREHSLKSAFAQEMQKIDSFTFSIKIMLQLFEIKHEFLKNSQWRKLKRSALPGAPLSVASMRSMGYDEKTCFTIIKEFTMIRVDLHTHTNHSHARDSVWQMFEAGREKGLLVQGFSEHSPRPSGYDYPVEYRDHLAATFHEYLAEVEDLKNKQHDVTVLLGLEVDWLEKEEPYIRQMAASHDYDYLIAGIHFLDRWGFDASAKDWEKLDIEERFCMYERYYRTMKVMADTKLFQIVAHPDLIKIFSAEDFRRWLDMPSSIDLVGDALTAVRDAGMAMEISSAGLRKSCREIYPGPKILRLARQIGLPITFASDSHATEQVAWNFSALARYAAEEGWRESLVFRRGEVMPMPFTAD